MKNFVIGTLAALVATQAAGCVISTDNGDYATVGATWEIKTVSGSVATCPPGFDTAALINVEVDGAGNPVTNCNDKRNDNQTTCFVDLFNCEDHAGVSAPLPPARYQTWVSITDHDGFNIYATSLSDYLDVTDIDLDFHTTIFDNGGYFAVDWDLKGASTQAPLSCSQAGVALVGTDVTVSGSTSFVDTNDWACEDHYGVTSVIPAGSYTVTVQALDSAAGYLGKAPEYTNKVISGPNKVTDLGTAVIAVDGK